MSTEGDGDNGPGAGSAYLFDLATGLQLAKLLPSDGAAADRFGTSVAISGSTAIVGADRDDNNDFTIEAAGLLLNEFGYFLMSESTDFVPGFGGSAGNLCLGAPIIRFSLSGQVLRSGATGAVGLTQDLTALPQGAVFLPSSTWYFQFWFRDTSTSNTSDGIEVMFR